MPEMEGGFSGDSMTLDKALPMKSPNLPFLVMSGSQDCSGRPHVGKGRQEAGQHCVVGRSWRIPTLTAILSKSERSGHTRWLDEPLSICWLTMAEGAWQTLVDKKSPEGQRGCWQDSCVDSPGPWETQA